MAFNMKKRHTIRTLPLAVELDILSRLPPKQLTRLRCVSKSWNAEIISPSFSKLYEQRRCKGRLETSSSNGGGCVVMTDNWSTLLLCNFRSNVLQPLPLPPNFAHSKCLDSCNGLLLFSVRSSPRSPEIDLSLYNPLNGAYTVLPRLVIDSNDHSGSKSTYIITNILHAGLGYDCVSDDYKILSIFQYHRPGGMIPSRYEAAYICTLKTNSWRILKSHSTSQDQGFPESNMVYWNNALHWISAATNYTENAIISALDLDTEKYYTLSIPDGVDTFDSSIKHNLVAVDGSLHFVSKEHTYKGDIYEIYIRNEYEVNNSWIRVFQYSAKELDIMCGLNSYRVPFTCAYSADEQEIVVCIELKPPTFICCNLQTRDIKNVELSGCCIPTSFDEGSMVFSVLPWVPSPSYPWTF